MTTKTTTTEISNSGTKRDAVAVTPKQSIRIFGIGIRCLPRTESRPAGPALKAYDQSYSIGDEAVYGSFNIDYIGRIVAIGAKTVTVSRLGERKTRMSLEKFSFYNRFNTVSAARRRNAEWMD